MDLFLQQDLFGFKFRIQGNQNRLYRNKMEYTGDEMKDGPLTLGLHKKEDI